MAASSDALPEGWAIEVVAMPSKALDYSVKDLVRAELIALLRGSGFPVTEDVHGAAAGAADLPSIAEATRGRKIFLANGSTFSQTAAAAAEQAAILTG